MVMLEKPQYDIAYSKLYFIWEFVCAAEMYWEKEGQGEVRLSAWGPSGMHQLICLYFDRTIH